MYIILLINYYFLLTQERLIVVFWALGASSARKKVRVICIISYYHNNPQQGHAHGRTRRQVREGILPPVGAASLLRRIFLAASSRRLRLAVRCAYHPRPARTSWCPPLRSSAASDGRDSVGSRTGPSGGSRRSAERRRPIPACRP